MASVGNRSGFEGFFSLSTAFFKVLTICHTRLELVGCGRTEEELFRSTFVHSKVALRFHPMSGLKMAKGCYEAYEALILSFLVFVV